MSIFRTVSVIISLLLLGAAVNVQAQVGTTSVPFLQIEPDSRAAGMGNTGVAVADNASAVFWNSAGLGFQEGREINFTRASWLPGFNTDMSYNYLVGKYHVDGIGTFGGHLTYLNLGEQTETGPDGEELGQFSSNELAAGISYGRQVTNNFSLGAGLRYIYSNLATGLEVGGRDIQSGTSVGVDLSGLYRSDFFDVAGRNADVSAGLHLSNIGPGIAYTDDEDTVEDPLPTMLRVGWSYFMELDTEGRNTITLSNDFSKIMARRDDDGEPMGSVEALFNSWDSITRHDGQQEVEITLAEQFMIGTGLEYWYDELFAIRSGYFYEAPNNGDRQFLTLGAGLRYDIFGVDFSYLYTLEEDHPLGNTIRISAQLNFN